MSSFLSCVWVGGVFVRFGFGTLATITSLVNTRKAAGH